MFKFEMNTSGFKRDLQSAVEQQANELLRESRQSLQREVDAVYHSRSGRSVEELTSDLRTRLNRLDFQFEAGEIEEWAQEISEDQRIEIRIKGKFDF